MKTYKRLFNTLINNFKNGTKDKLDELIDLLEKTGNDALDYIEKLDVDTLNQLKNEADFNKIYEKFFKTDNETSYSNDNEWFRKKEEKYRQEREKRKRERENRRNRYNQNSYEKKNYSSSNNYSNRYSSNNETDPFKIFGIPRNSKWRIIRATYVKLVKKYHPDTRNPNMSSRDKKEADIKLQKIYKAWEYFNDNKRRFN